jgi:hypothetical protein
MITLLKWVPNTNISSKPLILDENVRTSTPQWHHDLRSIQFGTVEHLNPGQESRYGSALYSRFAGLPMLEHYWREVREGYPLSKEPYRILKHTHSFKLIHKRNLFFESWRRRLIYTCTLRNINKGTKSSRCMVITSIQYIPLLYFYIRHYILNI